MHLTPDGTFVVENYNWQRPFSNFFHGIAGKFGIPCWAYYVSRGQAVCSMGVADKNHQIMEFLSFNKAQEVVGLQGFRTFVKVNGSVYEPFRKVREDSIVQRMEVTPEELRLVETNEALGLRFFVTFYPLTGTPFPGLVRKLEVENAGGSQIEFDLLDGLPRIFPYGVDIHCVQVIPRHVEGMMEVVSVDGIPVYRLKQIPADVEKIGGIEGGNFYMSFEAAAGRASHGGYFVDPYPVFLEQAIYDQPWGLESGTLQEMLAAPQVRRNRTPCAMTGQAVAIEAGEKYTLYSVVGFAPTDEKIGIASRLVSSAGFLERKREDNRVLIRGIMQNCLTISGDKRFDQYCEHTFLDNVVRGGLPVLFETRNGKSAFYLYSRQNGDLERDYHYFVLEPTYYSQGTGHYRSVNQNRRRDGWFFPGVEDCNIATFMNLIQLDGYNPLEVTQVSYSVVDFEAVRKWLDRTRLSEAQREELELLVGSPFTPGSLAMKLEEMGLAPGEELEEGVAQALALCEESECGAIWEGFWVDHWHYNLDLVDTYLTIYPDRLEELLVGNDRYYFYDDPDLVRPREEKYVLVDGRVFQYDAVWRDEAKGRLIAGRSTNPMRSRTEYGKGEIYYTNLLVKLLCVVTNRLATLDPRCVGTEMEADKPGWNDSMNGLPGILGSALGETLELERALKFISDSCGGLARAGASTSVPVYEELHSFMTQLEQAVERYLGSSLAAKRFVYWDESHAIKEDYRARTNYGVSGEEHAVGLPEIKRFADAGLRLLAESLDPDNSPCICNEDGVPYTYYENRVTRYEVLTDEAGDPRLSDSGHPLARPLEFEHRPLPLFLEGPMHMMRVRPHMAPQVYPAVRNSPIFDGKLRMYKVCESLAEAPFEIGRVKAWGPGWIENESVYTHMEYKHLLSILTSGLHREFFRDIETMLMPHIPPEVYGRSPIENVSFIVSSAFSDETMHGQGLQPRLSGVTGEMIHIWTLMVAGDAPFFLDESGTLAFALRPILAGRFFTSTSTSRAIVGPDGREVNVEVPANAFLFKLSGRTLVTYLNQGRKDTFGPGGCRVSGYELDYGDDRRVTIDGPVVSYPHSLDIREGRVACMKAVLK